MQIGKAINYKGKEYNCITLDHRIKKVVLTTAEDITIGIRRCNLYKLVLDSSEVRDVYNKVVDIFGEDFGIFENMERRANQEGYSIWEDIKTEDLKVEYPKIETNNDDIGIKLDKIIKLLEKISNSK